ncbi:MAG: hypothetical protein ACKVP0_14185 [Pirellulaceae bacterium]
MWVLIAIGGCLAVIGGLLTLLNFLLFLNYPLQRLRGGKPETYRHVSGIPIFGSLLLWIAALLLSSKPVLMWSALVVSLFDMCGLHVFAIVMFIVALRKPPNPHEKLLQRISP